MSTGFTLVRTTGAPATPAVVQHVREVSRADLALLESGTGRGSAPIKKIRDSHHSVARLFAEGRHLAEISAITGYTIPWLATLKGDPSFAELVAFYAAAKREVVSDVEVKLKHLLDDTVQELRERLDTDPDSFDVEDLQNQVKLLADRTGHGPSSRTTNVNVHLGLADRMAEAMKRVQAQRAPPLLEAE